MIASQTARQAKRKFSLKRWIISNWELTMLCLPALAAYILFNYAPMAGIIMAFKRYTYADGIFRSAWCGLNNFLFLVSSNDLPRIVGNTVSYSLTFLVLGMASKLIFALLLFEINSRRAVKLFQTCFTIPNFMSWVVVGFITYAIFQPNMGFLNQFRQALGLSRIDVYSDPFWWPLILTVATLWKSVGMGCLIYYAALMGIDPSLFEAATIDGANRWQQTKYVSIPSLVPLLCITGILSMGSLVGGDFGLFYQIPRNIPALYSKTDILSTYTFRALQNASFGISSAVSFSQSVISFILILSTNLVVKKISPENSMF